MSMLAESRGRKQNFVLQPRGKPLYEDANSFGSKMLSKMGWEPGKGLGAKENGKLDFIKVKYKHDVEGMGYEARDDQWTAHESSFNKLLNNLSNANSKVNSEEDNDGDDKIVGFQQNKDKYYHSGESLEQKSKQSRARVHYKKFTKSKDLSQYSAKDLANIFGKKSHEEPIFKSEEVRLKKEEPENQLKSSFVTVTSSVSLSDYFKQKMQNKLDELKIKKNEKPEQVSVENVQKNCDEFEVKKKKKKSKTNKIEDSVENLVLENIKSEILLEDIKPKKKKKDKLQSIEAIEIDDSAQLQENDSNQKTSNKKKKNRTKLDTEVETYEFLKEKKKRKSEKELAQSMEITDFEPIKKKSKKNKYETKIKEIIEHKSRKISNQDKLEVKQCVDNEKLTRKKKTKKDTQDHEELDNKSIAANKLPSKLNTLELEFNNNRREYLFQYLHKCRHELTPTTIDCHPIQAETLRNANLEGFKNSNLKEFLGYRLTPSANLNILPFKCNMEQLLQEQSLSYDTSLL